MSDKINEGTRKNSSISGAALMLGVTPDTLEHFLPLITLADKYHKSPDKLKRDELILRIESYCLALKFEHLEAQQRKQNKKK